MIVNYILLAITGIFSLLGVLDIIRKKPTHMIRTILFAIVFVLVLIATIKGMTYDQFYYSIQGNSTVS